MPYIGQDLQVAFPSYTNIDDISGSFDGVTTSFPLTVGGVAPVPAPLGSNQCLISVDGVVQRPDDTGTEGFRLSGGNIIFSSAPSIADDFFGIILAGADYVNVGANFPDGTLGAPSITFDQDNDTGYYRSGSGSVSFASNGVAAGTWSSAGVTAPALIPTGSSVPTNGVYLPAANSVGVATNGSGRLFINSTGLVGIGTSSPQQKLAVVSSGVGYEIDQSSLANTNLLLSYDRAASAYRAVANYYGGTYSWNDSGTERMRIDSLGRVGIGVTSPSNQAHIYRTDSGTSNGALRLDGNGNYAGVQFAVSGTNYGSISSDTASLYITHASSINFNTGGSGNVGGTERARIDSSGRLLIGTSTSIDSASKLQVKDGYINIYHADSAVNSGYGVNFSSDGGATGRTHARIDLAQTAGNGGTLKFSTTADGASSPTERMRIANDGTTTVQVDGVNVFRVSQSGATIGGRGRVVVTNDASLINTFAGQLTVSANASATGGATVGIASDNAEVANTAWKHFQGRVSGGTITVNIFGNGDIQNTNNSYAGISDLKLKENIVDATSQWDDIKALQVRKYNFKEGQTHTQIGLVAQEVELVSPGLVSESPDREEDGNDLGTVTKSVNYSVLYMKAVKALQEAMERIEQLETSNADLLARVTALESA